MDARFNLRTRPPEISASWLADFTVFKDFVEHVREGGGAVASGVLRGLEVAGNRVKTLAGSAELVGDVEGGEDGDTEAVDGVAESGYSAHLGVDEVDLDHGRVSWISPVARALVKARIGDQVTLHTPAGPEPIDIIDVVYPPPDEGG